MISTISFFISSVSLIVICYAFTGSEKSFILRVVLHELTRVVRFVIVVYLELIAYGFDLCKPSDLIDDRFRAEVFESSADYFEGEPFKEFVNLRVLRVVLVEIVLAFHCLLM